MLFLLFATQVVVLQAYKNNNSVPIEAKYVFPLDDMAAGTWVVIVIVVVVIVVRVRNRNAKCKKKTMKNKTKQQQQQQQQQTEDRMKGIMACFARLQCAVLKRSLMENTSLVK